jgi:hypothetical protein
MLSMTRPRFAVATNNVRRKIFGIGLSLRSRGVSGPKKMTVGCVIFKVPRRKSVSQATVADTNKETTEIRTEIIYSKRYANSDQNTTRFLLALNGCVPILRKPRRVGQLAVCAVLNFPHRLTYMEKFLIRPAVVSEQKELEYLQRRASLTNAGDRDALLAHPDAIELPLEQIATGAVFVAEQNGAIAGFATVLPRDDGGAELDATS